MSTLFYEDFHVGWTETYGPLKVTQDAIIRFAKEYDDQPFHTDPEAAKHTFPGRLISSGWHSCALANRLLVEHLFLITTSQGSPGIEAARWISPLYPDDEVHLTVSVIEARTLKSRPTLGMLKMSLELKKQDGSLSTVMTGTVFLKRRHPDEEYYQLENLTFPAKKADSAAEKPIPQSAILFLEEFIPGTTFDLGSHLFSSEEIIRFAREFDPQYFHTDAAAAKDSLFGGLCASGWNTAANWMRQTSKLARRLEKEMLEAGIPVPAQGPSPGFTNLKWLKPVFANDTISYCTTVTQTRASASRPGWGLLSCHNTGNNQNGERVFEFDSIVFRQMKSR
ncbi:MaoC family dehydratase [Microvirga sp. W0021]|uniref:MaoC family dehydratase n=1 Tax=Hohaiivirga grylli TaxID=3133970 RepID=A0ABV0BJH0_9HYPH